MVKYPKLNRTSLPKVVTLLLSNVFLISVTLVIGIHGRWRDVWRTMLNQETFHWNVGILWLTGSVNCDAVNEPTFYAVCMSVFKNLYGSLSRVSSFVCNLDTIKLKVEPQYIDDARMYRQSCSETQTILTNSIATFVVLIISVLCLAAAIICLLRFAYKQFAFRYRVLYWSTCGFQIAATIFLALSLGLYHLTVVPYFNSILIYANIENPEACPITSRHVDQIGPAYITLIFFLVLYLLVAFLSFLWIPVLAPDESLVLPKKSPGVTSKHSRSRKTHPEEQVMLQAAPYEVSASTSPSFWAYMPEVFQPHTYVAEVTEPMEFVGVPYYEDYR